MEWFPGMPVVFRKPAAISRRRFPEVIPGLQPSYQEDWSVFLAMVCTHARP